MCVYTQTHRYTHMCFIITHMHRKTKETYTEMLKVNFLWVAKR